MDNFRETNFIKVLKMVRIEPWRTYTLRIDNCGFSCLVQFYFIFIIWNEKYIMVVGIQNYLLLLFALLLYF